jgi:RNA polymerase sigma-70 factor (ECF subfamily)
MTQAIATERISGHAAEKDDIRPFDVNAPEADMTGLRRRIKATKWQSLEMNAAMVEPETLDAANDDVGTSALNDLLPVFARVRPRLFGIAYRILKNAADAEDIVQDVWLRWACANRSTVLDPPAFLMTATARLAINLVQSAHSRREVCAESFPEPVDTSADPGLDAERSEAVNRAIAMLLEKLPPTERAAYVLREAFDYSYHQIANTLQRGEASTRQLVARARKHLVDGRSAPVEEAEHRHLLVAFIGAAHKGDFAGLERALAGIC